MEGKKFLYIYIKYVLEKIYIKYFINPMGTDGC